MIPMPRIIQRKSVEAQLHDDLVFVLNGATNTNHAVSLCQIAQMIPRRTGHPRRGSLLALALIRALGKKVQDRSGEACRHCQ